MAGIGEEALHDELYNFLAAKGFLEQGGFFIAEGADPYTRGAIFTKIVAMAMGFFSPSLSVARLPALAAGCLSAAIVFLWLHVSKERVAAWIAGMLVAFDPLLIQLSQIVRFYTLQHLAFLSGTVGVSWLLFPKKTSFMAKTIVLILTIIAFVVAMKLQPVSVIGLGGVVLFTAIVVYWDNVRSLPVKAKLWITITTLTFLSVMFGFALIKGTITKYVEFYTYADLWAASSVDNPRYYYAILHSNYAPLWSLSPLLLLFAIMRQPRLTMLCTAVFGIGFIGLSFAAWKAERYLSYLVYFFFVISGIGLASGIEFLWQYISRLIGQIEIRNMPDRIRLSVATGMTAVVLGFAMLGNYAFLTTARLQKRDHDLSFPLMGIRDGTISWSQAAAKLKPISENVEVVVSSDELKALYYLGRVDYHLSPNTLFSKKGRRAEFWQDPRTNVRVIASTESVAEIIRCHRSGLFVVQSMSLGQSATARPRLEATRYIAERAELIDLPKEWGILAYRWQTSPEELKTGCPREG